MNNKYIGVALVGMLVALSGCSKKHAQASVGVGSSNYANNITAAKSYAAGDDGNVFSGQDGLYAKVINQMKAPSNQTYYFAYDGNIVSADDLAFIQMQANYLVAHPNVKVRLDGNTDNRGSREYNIGLGWRRDKAVALILQQAGVKPEQIDMVSYGKEKPAVLGNNERAWRLSRRVNLRYEEDQV
jgi:peptidoglycan-associated lipoprotein